MRGLTPDERFHLGRWSRGEYQYAGNAPPEVDEVYLALLARGCAGESNDRAVTTPMGELALRVDEVVRKAGIL